MTKENRILIDMAAVLPRPALYEVGAAQIKIMYFQLQVETISSDL